MCQETRVSDQKTSRVSVEAEDAINAEAHAMPMSKKTKSKTSLEDDKA